MFSDETNELVQTAMDARDAVVSARSTALEKTKARAEAAAQEAETNAALATAQKEAGIARDAALKAISHEMDIPPVEAPAPAPAPARAAVVSPVHRSAARSR